MADEPSKARSPDAGRNVIRLGGRYDYRRRIRPVLRKAPARPASTEELRAVLDQLLVAQFELCGVDPHPTRASLSEMRFRQAREALAQAMALLQKLAAGTKPMPASDAATPATDSPTPANDSAMSKPRVDVRAAD